MSVIDLDKLSFRQAKKYTRANRPLSSIDLLVTHTSANRPSASGAEDLQAYFATMSDGRDASAHGTVDSNSITLSVRWEDVAWHAPGANHDGVGIELFHVYEPSTADWRSVYSVDLLENLADFYAALCIKLDLPPVWLGPADLLADRRGITTHRAVSQAFRRSDHYDPGPVFPVSTFMPMLKKRISGQDPPPPVKLWPNLYEGDGFDDDGKRFWVAKLQVLLDQHPKIRLKPPGWSPATPLVKHDGKFGPQTKKAVVQFQEIAGIWATGKVGPPTWNALKLAVHHIGRTDAQRRADVA